MGDNSSTVVFWMRWILHDKLPSSIKYYKQQFINHCTDGQLFGGILVEVLTIVEE